MLNLANQFVARATRLIFAAHDDPALWSAWRLSWFNGADPRLAGYVGPLDGDIDALAATLSARLGAPVRLESLPV